MEGFPVLQESSRNLVTIETCSNSRHNQSKFSTKRYGNWEGHGGNQHIYNSFSNVEEGMWGGRRQGEHCDGCHVVEAVKDNGLQDNFGRLLMNQPNNNGTSGELKCRQDDKDCQDQGANCSCDGNGCKFVHTFEQDGLIFLFFSCFWKYIPGGHAYSWSNGENNRLQIYLNGCIGQ